MDDDLWNPKTGETSEPTSAPHEVTGENAQTAHEMPQNDAADSAKSDDEQGDSDSGNGDNTKSAVPQENGEKSSAGVNDGQAVEDKAAVSVEGDESHATSLEESNEEEGEKKEEEDSWSPSYRPGDNINSFVDPETGGYYNNMGGRVFGKSSWEGSYPSTYSQRNPSKPASTQEETQEEEDADDSEEVTDEKEADEQEDAEEAVDKSQETDGTEKKAISFGPDVSKLSHHVFDEVKEIASRLSNNPALRNDAVHNKDDNEDDDDSDDDDVSELPQGDDPSAYNVKEEVPEEVKVATSNDENSIYGKGQNIAMSQINAMKAPVAAEKKKKNDEVKKANRDSSLEEKKKKSKFVDWDDWDASAFDDYVYDEDDSEEDKKGSEDDSGNSSSNEYDDDDEEEEDDDDDEEEDDESEEYYDSDEDADEEESMLEGDDKKKVNPNEGTGAKDADNVSEDRNSSDDDDDDDEDESEEYYDDWYDEFDDSVYDAFDDDDDEEESEEEQDPDEKYDITEHENGDITISPIPKGQFGRGNTRSPASAVKSTASPPFKKTQKAPSIDKMPMEADKAASHADKSHYSQGVIYDPDYPHVKTKPSVKKDLSGPAAKRKSFTNDEDNQMEDSPSSSDNKEKKKKNRKKAKKNQVQNQEQLPMWPESGYGEPPYGSVEELKAAHAKAKKADGSVKEDVPSVKKTKQVEDGEKQQGILGWLKNKEAKEASVTGHFGSLDQHVNTESAVSTSPNPPPPGAGGQQRPLTSTTIGYWTDIMMGDQPVLVDDALDSEESVDEEGFVQSHPIGI